MRYLFFIGISALLLIACNNPSDTDPLVESVRIISPENGSLVSENVVIEVSATGGEIIRMVELWVDDQPTGSTDNIRPFLFEWLTTALPDSSIHTLFIRVYYSNNRRIDSDKIQVIVNNSQSAPTQSRITSVRTVGSTFIIAWTENEDPDFQAYVVHESFNENMTDSRTVSTIFERSNTSHIIYNIAAEEVRYYQVVVRDIYGLEIASNIKKGNTLSEVLFVSNRTGNDEIFLMLSDGSNSVNLSERENDDYNPGFSPDQSMIVFISERTGNPEIFAMTSDGKKQTNYSNQPGYDNEPIFSPDGEQIAFTSVWDNNSDIYMVHKTGGVPRRMTDSDADDSSPQFSQIGPFLIFVSDRTGNPEIYRMEMNGNNLTNLTNNNAEDYGPQVSPDGSEVIFVSDRNGSDDIYALDINSAEENRLTSLPGDERFPRFSPDGLKIVFQYEVNNNSQIFMINDDGSNQIVLSGEYTNERYPEFSISGLKIFFQSQRDGNNEVYRMDLNGSNQQNLTINPADDRLRIIISQD